ncbi:MAG: hypothetical protein AB8H80_11845 [Planctomycetota bacterium]
MIETVSTVRTACQLMAAAVISSALASTLVRPAVAQEQASRLASPPAELGKVAWLRDETKAQGVAAATGKPLLVLFQEVPG